MGRIYHRTPQKVNTFYHKLNIEELLVCCFSRSMLRGYAVKLLCGTETLEIASR